MARPRIYNPTPLAVGQFRQEPRTDRTVMVESIGIGGARAGVRTVTRDAVKGFVAAEGSRSSNVDATRLSTWPLVQDTPAGAAK
jgi:hypothetical protein